MRRASVNTIYWGFGPNDIIRDGKLYSRGGGVVELWAEGVKPKDVEIWVRFVGVDSRDEFKKAYDLILSNKRLPDEQPEWPTEIKTAVAGRSVMEGMTKAQAFVGGWYTDHHRQPRGGGQEDRNLVSAPGHRHFRKLEKRDQLDHRFPASLRFVDGKLAAIINTAGPVKLNLDE